MIDSTVFTHELAALRYFIPEAQLYALAEMFDSEEHGYATSTLKSLTKAIVELPKPYETENTADPIAYLHYFGSNTDFYIVERDTSGVQHQAFGLSIIDFAEKGYISLPELFKNDIEIDFNFSPKPLSECK